MSGRKVTMTYQCTEQEAVFFQSFPKTLGITMSAVVRDALYFYYKNHLSKNDNVAKKIEAYKPEGEKNFAA